MAISETTNRDGRSRYIRIAAALLRHAAQCGRAGEARSYRDRARSLMQQHEITDSDLEQAEIDEWEVGLVRALRLWQLSTLEIATKETDCTMRVLPVLRGSAARGRFQVIVRGPRGNLQRCQRLYARWVAHIPMLAMNVLHRSPAFRTLFRSDPDRMLRAVVYGIGGGLIDTRRAMHEQQVQDDDLITAPTQQDHNRSQLEREHMAKIMADLGEQFPQFLDGQQVADSHIDGYLAGRSIGAVLYQFARDWMPKLPGRDYHT